MTLDLRARGFEISEKLRAHVEKRLDFALSRFAERIGQVRVRLEDVNGPRKGKDKQCRIRIAGRPSWTVLVEETATDLFEAIDRAFDRAGRSVARAAGKVREPRAQAARQGSR